MPAIRTQGALRQPGAVPIRVIACSVGELGAQGIGDDVTGCRADIFIATQRVIMEAASPDAQVRFRSPEALAGD
jgi:hypothetical protein